MTRSCDKPVRLEHLPSSPPPLLCGGAALQQMGPAARKSLALDLEKKAIQMALEEGEVAVVAMGVLTVLRGGSGGGWWGAAREMKRVRRLAIMSRRLPMDQTPTHVHPSWHSPTDLRIAHKARGGGNSLLYKFEAWAPRRGNMAE